MPHGSLTPLGRRLRSVLATLSPVTRDLDYNNSTTARFPQCRPTYTTNALARPANALRPHDRHRTITPVTSSRAQHVASAPVQYPQPPAREHQPKRKPGRQQLNRRTKIDHLGNELRRQGKDLVAPRVKPNKASNHFSFRRPDVHRIHKENEKRHASDYSPPLEKDKTPNLMRILASYLRITEATDGKLHDRSTPFFEVASADREFLRRKGHDIADLKAWATIITEQDSFEAATLLQRRAEIHGPLSIPLPVFSYILRRPHISARALRIFITHAWHLFEHVERDLPGTITTDTVFVVFNRLVRHARKVWPGALTSIADHLLRFMPKLRADSDGDISRSAQRASFVLNKAMYLISEPTAVAPYKDVPHQEAAVVRILTALNEYDVPLQIDREGYRAVIRLQLASPKTSNERRWAGLKALSWPPWKEDQTRMDSEIGPEDGISKAGETIRRMQEAGYRLQNWEKVAKVYAGWDVDGTPTIQRRTTLQPVRPGHDPGAALWVARINTTRTVQEAWACYLAYEEGHERLDQDVLLAIFEKTLEESKRQYAESNFDGDRQKFQGFAVKRLFPGDTREIEPLPPSTHLYTYTRVDPPTTRQLFFQLRQRDVSLREQCLAFLISNAHSVKDCVVYLDHARIQYPSMSGILELDSSSDLHNVPNDLFEAYISFLARFADNLMAREIRENHRNPVMTVPSRRLGDENFNFDHCLIQAIWLLKERKTLHLPSWNAVLDALAEDHNYTRLHLTQTAHERFLDTNDRPDPNFNAILAYRLTKYVLTVLSSLHLDLDIYGFIALCRSTENVGIACWQLLREDYAADDPPESNGHDSPSVDVDGDRGTPKTPIPVQEAKHLLAREKPHWRLEQLFRRLVGEQSYLDPTHVPGEALKTSTTEAEVGLDLPRLLTSPGPAVLHAYVRALGWCGAHDSILDTVRWMVEYRDEFADAASRDRNGANVTRRTIIAIRVFLERSWLVECDGIAEGEADEYDALPPHEGEQARAHVSDTKKCLALQRLEQAASEHVIDDVQNLIESVKEWGGWASDEEVAEYIQGGKDKFERMS